MMETYLLQILMALIGSFGFGMLFRVTGSKLITIAMGGAFNWIVYLAALWTTDDRVTAFFAAALATAAAAEIAARAIKTPVLTMMVPMMVPLVPGGDLYYTTLALVQGDMTRFAEMGSLVLKEAGAISFGIILTGCAVQTALRTAAIVRQGRKKE